MEYSSIKIVNVTPGLIPIPPNGWGAIEKIIWSIHQSLQLEDHNSVISHLDDIPKDADIVHIHVANLANLAYERGIPYYFTFHDHHAYLYGKDSDLYKENLKAMKNSIKSFVPAKYLVDYFEGIPEYFSHGVDTSYFCPTSTASKHKLLCVANNGYSYDQTIDRKGFSIAIEAAKILGLPITIAGPSNNKNYFEKYPPNYDKLTILYNLTEEQLLKLYREHSIFLHLSELEAGHPNLTLLEALACGLPIVGTFEKNNHLDGMIITDRSVNDVVKNIENIIKEYYRFSLSARKQAERLDWVNRTKDLLKKYETKTVTMKEQLLKHYTTTKRLQKNLIKKIDIGTMINHHNIDGMFVEILGGNEEHQYDANFIRQDTNESVYRVNLTKNTWGKTNIKYFVNWKVVVTNKNTNQITEIKTNLKGKNVLISLESKSLGDTLAWIPYVEEFRKQHDCNVICSTFWNSLFIDQYRNIKFIKPGEVVHNIYANYQLGLFYKNDTVDYDKHPRNPIQGPLQKIASDILGLSYKEIRPSIKEPVVVPDSKQICIAIHSTAQAKYWNNSTGWQVVVDWLNNKGYSVKLLSNEEDGYMGNKNPVGVIRHPTGPIEETIKELKKSKLFIGISSGLSWLSWSMNIPTVVISGFTHPINEMQDCIRITTPQNKCTGCWNRHKFDPSDWNWCPDHKGTSRQFECSKEITPEMVIKELEKIL